MIKRLVVLLLLAYAAYHTTYTIHEKYPLPFHSDEWDHLGLSMHLVRKGSIESIRAYNPFTNTPYRVNREPAYHLLIGLLYLAAGLELTRFAILVPTVFAFILAVNTLAFVRHTTKSWVAGLIAAVFALTIKSNVTFLGIWFLVPMALGIALAPLILHLLARAFNHPRQLNGFDMVFILLVSTTLIIHPPSATVYIPITLVYLLYNWQLAIEKKQKLMYFAAAAVAATTAFLLITAVPLKVLSDPVSLLTNHLYFGSGDYGTNMIFSYKTFLGDDFVFGKSLIFVLAAAGTYHTVHSDNKKERILPLTLIPLLLLVSQGYRTGGLYFSTYRRIFMFTGEMILILAAVGLYYIYYNIVSLARKMTGDWIFTGITRVALLIVIISVINTQVESTFKYKQRLYHVIGESDVQPIKWLSENTPEGSVVIAKSSVSQAITPISGRFVVGIEKTMMRSTPERWGDTNHFFNPPCDCGCKLKRINKYGVNYVYGRQSISCPFLKPVHSAGAVRIYQVV